MNMILFLVLFVFLFLFMAISIIVIDYISDKSGKNVSFVVPIIIGLAISFSEFFVIKLIINLN